MMTPPNIDYEAEEKIHKRFHDYLIEHPHTLVVKMELSGIPQYLANNTKIFGTFVNQLQAKVDKQFKLEQSQCGCPVHALANRRWVEGRLRYRVALMLNLDAFQRISKDEVVKQIKGWIYSVWAMQLRVSLNSVGPLVSFSPNDNFIGLIAGRDDYGDRADAIVEQISSLASIVQLPTGELSSTYIYRAGKVNWRGINPPKRYFRRYGQMVNIAPR